MDPENNEDSRIQDLEQDVKRKSKDIVKNNVKKAAKYAAALAGAIFIQILPIILLASIIFTAVSWVLEIIFTDNTSKTIYEELGVSTLNDFVVIKGDESSGYYYEFKEDIDTTLENLSKTLKEIGNVKTVDEDLLKLMIQAEVVSKFPNLGKDIDTTGQMIDEDLKNLDRFMFIGDSITEGLRDNGGISGASFYAVTGSNPGNWYKEETTSYGSCTYDKNANPKAICVMLGTNNPYQISEMKSFLANLRSTYPDKVIFVQKLLPLASHQDQIDKFNAEMQKLCAENDKFEFIDATKNVTLSSDNIHPNTDSYPVLAQNITNSITIEVGPEVEDLSKYINDNCTDGKWSVLLKELTSGEEVVNVNNTQESKLKSGQLVQVFMAAAIANEANQGNLKQDDAFEYIHRLCLSANPESYTNGVIKIYKEQIKKYLADNGYKDTEINDNIKDCYTSTSDISKLLNNIYTNKCVNFEYSQKMIEKLKANNSYIKGLLPDGLEVAEITGGIVCDDVRNTAAIIYRDGNPYILTVMASGVSNADDAKAKIEEIAKRSYEVVSGKIEGKTQNGTPASEVAGNFQGAIHIRRVMPDKKFAEMKSLVTDLDKTTTSQETKYNIEEYLSTFVQQGTWAVYAKRLDTGEEKVRSNESQLRAASLIKIFIMATAFDEIEKGELSKDEVIEDIKIMINKSDNDATNRMIDRLGFDKINNYIKKNGHLSTQINRKMLADTTNGDNYTSTVDVAGILEKIYKGQCVSEAASREMLNILKTQTLRNKIPAGLPTNVQVASKTGELENDVENDAAIVFKDGAPYVFVTMSNDVGDSSTAISHIAKMSEIMYNIIDGQSDGMIIETSQSTTQSSGVKSRVFDLKYISPERFDELIENNSSDVLKYFTLDEKMKLIVANWTYSNDEGLQVSKMSPVNYMKVMQKYTMPIEYLLAWLIDSKDKVFVKDLAQLAIDSQYIIAVEDNVTTTQTDVYTYSQTTRYTNEGTVNASMPRVQTGHTTSISETVNTKLELTYADAWFVKVEKELASLSGESLGQTDNYKSISYYKTVDGLSGTAKENSSSKTETTGQTREDITETYDGGGAGPVETTTGYSITTTEQQTDIKTMIVNYSTGDTKVSGNEEKFKEIFLNSPKVQYSLKQSWLETLLKRNAKTASMVDLTNYLLWYATGIDFGITDFSEKYEKYKDNDFSGRSGIYGGTIQEKVWFAVLDAGYSKEAAAGVMGNIEAESGFDVGAIEGGNAIGGGLCQWSFGRRSQLEQYAASKGTEWVDENTQVEFLIGEITPGGGANGFASYQMMTYNGYGPSDWENATTPEDAAIAFCWSFERPGIPRMEVRTEAARRYYEEFKDKVRSSSNSITEAAENVHRYVRENNYYYAQAGISVPNYATNTIDCSSFVTWALVEAGVEGFSEGMSQWSSYTFRDNPLGWEVVSIGEEQPGDILVYASSMGSSWDHVEICAGDGGVYDCGSDTNIQRAEWNGRPDVSPQTGQPSVILRAP